MSHKATHWLATLRGLKSGEFRVLFVLCDAHNSDNGCFPRQSYLLERTEMSNGALNENLNRLEDKGLIRRQRRFNQATKKAMSTIYILGCDGEMAQEPSPENGEWSDSIFPAEPTPENGQSRLRPTGDITGKGTGKGTGNSLSLPLEDVILNEFERLWKIWPKKAGKAPALKAYRSARKRAGLREIATGALAYAEFINRKPRHEQARFCKMLQGWLNDSRWLDDMDGSLDFGGVDQSAFAGWADDSASDPIRRLNGGDHAH